MLSEFTKKISNYLDTHVTRGVIPTSRAAAEQVTALNRIADGLHRIADIMGEEKKQTET